MLGVISCPTTAGARQQSPNAILLQPSLNGFGVAGNGHDHIQLRRGGWTQVRIGEVPIEVELEVGPEPCEITDDGI